MAVRERSAAGFGGPPGLAEALARIFPGCELLGVDPVGEDTRAGATRKACGYALPLRLCIRTRSGENRCLVFRTAVPDRFGHDRRADRAGQLLLAFDTFNQIAGHVRALDVGFATPDGLCSLRDAGEPWLLTSYVFGEPYATDLRRIARAGALEERDLQRLDELVRWLADLHSERVEDAVASRRALRDVLGSGEGIFGVVDAYPDDVAGAPLEALRELERLALDWRWKLRGGAERARRIHGDFHPFNIVFGEGTEFAAIDASRGCVGDPADDLTALAVNFVFFALESPSGWRGGLGRLWHRFWRGWIEATGDAAVLDVAPPYLAWRLLVVACPIFYPATPAPARAKLLAFARRALTRGFHPEHAEDLFA
jgi:aminoglycoside phosphotransferase (APT) family kinase protein